MPYISITREVKKLFREKADPFLGFRSTENEKGEVWFEEDTLAALKERALKGESISDTIFRVLTLANKRSN